MSGSASRLLPSHWIELRNGGRWVCRFFVSAIGAAAQEADLFEQRA